MSLRTPSTLGGVDDDDRDLEVTQLGDRFGRCEAEAAGEDEVGLQSDDLLDIDAGERRDVGQCRRLSGIVAPSSVATTRSPAPSWNRISVVAGVRDTIFFGSAASSTDVPTSSVIVTGKAGVGLGLGDAAASLAAAEGLGATDGAGDDDAPPDEQAGRRWRAGAGEERGDAAASIS